MPFLARPDLLQEEVAVHLFWRDLFWKDFFWKDFFWKDLFWKELTVLAKVLFFIIGSNASLFFRSGSEASFFFELLLYQILHNGVGSDHDQEEQ